MTLLALAAGMAPAAHAAADELVAVRYTITRDKQLRGAHEAANGSCLRRAVDRRSEARGPAGDRGKAEAGNENVLAELAELARLCESAG